MHDEQAATTTVRQRTPATTSPYLKRVGGEPQEQGSVGITNPLPARAVGTPTKWKQNYSTKQRKIEKSLDHNPEPTESTHVEATRVTPRPATRVGLEQHNVEANPRHTPVETKELTEHRSNHVRQKSHNTSTNISDLHEIEKEQPGVTPRDTKQPSENERLTTGMATSDLHKVDGPQAEPPYTSDMPRGQGTTPYSATTNDTKERVTETVVECLHKAPRENPQSGNH
ncbi:hypothetical protein Taro_043736 [Colocasia esculenta]|uniref:Uncharacterized protein n=1 Tax=Colocasia esculenta TaxID=4460 RepID=A0A843WWI5_COLES|nr:hypothetical protein [Colocasia esculenta]